MSVHVLGSGIAALCTAYTLLKEGYTVRLSSQSHGLSPECASWWAGGMLAPYCEMEQAHDPVILELGRQSLAFWQQFPFTTTQGTLVVASTAHAAELKRFARRTTHFEQVDAEGVARLEPDLAGRFSSGLFFKEEAHLDPREAMLFLQKYVQKNAASVEYGVTVSDIPPEGLCIDARGFGARDQLPNLRGVRGEMLILKTNEVRLSRPVRLLHPRIPLYIVPRANGLFMVGATMVESDSRAPITARAVLELLSAAHALHPAFAEAEVVEMGVGVRPSYPDNVPRLTRSGNTLFFNGLYRHGFLASPALAHQALRLL
jgi:glycine oxidase